MCVGEVLPSYAHLTYTSSYTRNQRLNFATKKIGDDRGIVGCGLKPFDHTLLSMELLIVNYAS